MVFRYKTKEYRQLPVLLFKARINICFNLNCDSTRIVFGQILTMYKHTWSNYYILQYKTKYTNVNMWFKMLSKGKKDSSITTLVFNKELLETQTCMFNRVNLINVTL